MKLTDLKGIGAKTEQLFNKTGVFTVEDLIYNYPVNYDHYSEPVAVSECILDRKCAVYGFLHKAPDVKKIRNLTIITTTISDSSGVLQLTWFNALYLRGQLKQGCRYIFRGKVISKNGRLTMEHPEVFTLDSYEEKIRTLQPIYHLTKGLSNLTVQKAVKQAFEVCRFEIDDYLSDKIKKKYDLMDWVSAIRFIHFPLNMDLLIQARRRLVFDEFLEFIIGIRKLKDAGERIENHFPIKETWTTEEIIEGLPYKLTNSQMRCWQEIEKDLCGRKLMSRLVQGDVGSGKTILAFLSMILTAENGYQSALMAPTEVLAKQHYEGLCKLLNEQGLTNFNVTYLAGSLTAAQKRKAYEEIVSGQVHMIIGTHALIQDKVEYAKLGLVIIDEQHRFGVKQREMLMMKGNPPNVLVMSATPIPRTLAIILYGDLDISVLDELPSSRIPIKNCVVGTSYRKTAYKFMENEIRKGHQVYVICPMVEESEESEGENVEDYSEMLRKVFPEDIVIGMLHGQMKQEQKDRIMEAFTNNEIQILVSTTVVEVGVDVPNATVMMIENAERFGLAQLHQLRGRVGRGAWQSYCIFMQSDGISEISKRLDILNKSNDGFKIAEEDLKLRGPGDFFGIRQSGDMGFVLANIIQDADILKQAAELAPYVEDKIEAKITII